MPLLCSLDCLLYGQLAAQELIRLLVPERGERSRIRSVTVDQPLGLVHQATPEHSRRPLVDTFIEACAIRVEAQSQDAETAQRIAPFLPELGHLLPRSQAHFYGADQLRRVVGVDLFGRTRVKSQQDPVEIVRSPEGS